MTAFSNCLQRRREAMQATSLGIAPAFIAGQLSDYVDLDAAFLLKRDREPAFSYRDGMIQSPGASWGFP